MNVAWTRVLHRALERLEPLVWKLTCPVLRGLGLATALGVQSKLMKGNIIETNT
ncbi:hypothetical protein GMMP15_1370011 [Candidatus Magnetomoraceae bacterium gMMP-15]